MGDDETYAVQTMVTTNMKKSPVIQLKGREMKKRKEVE